MIKRYTRPEMGAVWELENKYRKWLDVELAVCEAWAEMGKIPRGSLRAIKERAGFDSGRIEEIEAEVKHDVIAFLTSVAEHVGPDSRYVHMGLTSSDVLDTALSLLMRQSLDMIIRDVRALREALKEKAFEHKDTPCMGRSHGVHAEPMTFGLKFALWHVEMGRNLERLRRAKKAISVGKLSGAVGTFSNVPPRLEEMVLGKLGLRPEPVATQVVQRDRHAEYIATLAILGAGVEKIAVEMRHLQRTEVLEAEEPFARGQKGSSAMPHKRNPVGAENLSGLARILRANSLAALEDVALWHERDISHSSVERVIIPDSSILADYMLRRLTGMVRGMHVYPRRMKENMGLSYGLHNSQRLMLALVDKGLSREEAYALVQRAAMESWRRRKDFKGLVKKDRAIRKHLKASEIDAVFDPGHYLRNVDFVFKRAFGGK
ncbi:MAG: adenylosuccinate lyase [Nitrospirota bacterium]|jgi:adenylosuccinate lyase